MVTADYGWRRGASSAVEDERRRGLGEIADVRNASSSSGSATRCPCVGRDFWWHDLMAEAVGRLPRRADGQRNASVRPLHQRLDRKTQGDRAHDGGIQSLAKKTTEWVFDLREDDIYWCTADIGWITGHTYVVYGPLSAGASVFMYEGAPNCPAKDRWWTLIEKYKINILYTAPTAICTFIKWGDHWVDKHDLSSLRLLGSVGEGINPEAWMWYYERIGGGRCPIVDTWWQTETGSIMMSSAPGAISAQAWLVYQAAAGRLAGDRSRRRQTGREPGKGGWLVIAKPWPGMLRGIWGDDERYKNQYWRDVPGKYLCGDNARCDEDGYYWIMGRIDDVLNVSGHRLSTIEIEAPWSATPRSLRRPRSAVRTTSRARRSPPLSPSRRMPNPRKS